jgi:4-hydroxybenzoyl-CoA reductase subunit beta
MEWLPAFRLIRPASVADALAARTAEPEARYLAGGTDLVPNIRRGIAAPPALIDLTGIAELRAIASGDDGGLWIGAAVTLAELIEHPAVARGWPVLAAAAGEVAAGSHREAATVGGNLCLDTRCVYYNQSEWWRKSNNYCLKSQGEICHVAPKGRHCFAAYSGDLAPALLVMAATVELASAGGRRVVPLAALYREDGRDHLCLAPGELLVGVRVPAAVGWRAGYRKARVRSAIDFPLAGVAAAIACDGPTVSGLRLALTGTNSLPLVVAGTDAFLATALDAAGLDRLAALLGKQIQPMSSTFTPPGYRRRVVARLARRLVGELYTAAVAGS